MGGFRSTLRRQPAGVFGSPAQNMGGENHAEKYEGKRRADWLCGAKIGEWFGAKIVLILKCCAAAFPVGINSVTKCVLGGF